ncbi:YkgJ family cysteine cluster protein [Haloglomus litoreum]|uniref:YkgJ family cysteine cluster protein n=1 Tax=Haloglomus litoreum TaxID=3034026 RepID=UPI0023E86F4D|nr:YkgJ family cysteine cluster protein [Haloglomus sp. DT116]
MQSLEADLAAARDLETADLADAIEAIGFECTRCGACCKAETCGDADDGSESADGGDGREGVTGGDGADGAPEPHTATVFPDEVRELQAATAASDEFEREYDWRDVARPMPYGLREGPDGPEGETFEWALATDSCGDCTFYREGPDGTGACSVHGSRPLICRTYPFSVVLDGSGDDAEEGGAELAQPMGAAVDREGAVRAHECEGLGRDISHADAEDLAAALKERAVRELEEAIAVRDRYEPTDADGVVVHDSEGAKRPDGTPLDGVE